MATSITTATTIIFTITLTATTTTTARLPKAHVLGVGGRTVPSRMVPAWRMQ